jgi:hypothetical protein
MKEIWLLKKTLLSEGFPGGQYNIENVTFIFPASMWINLEKEQYEGKLRKHIAWLKDIDGSCWSFELLMSGCRSQQDFGQSNVPATNEDKNWK